METIINYLDNVFAGLPKTDQVRNLKAELLANMEDKYRELKDNGTSEGEAIRIVISEFGSIDELLESMDILNEEAESKETLPMISRAEAYDFLDARRRSRLLIALGVFFCVFSPGVYMIISGDFNGSISEFRETIGLIPFFLMIAVAVALFISSSFMMKAYEYLTQSAFVLEYGLRDTLEEHRASYQLTYVTTLVIGVLLCILSPLSVIIMGSTGNSFLDNFGVSVLLFMVACAVFLFIYFGGIKSGYDILLQTEACEPCGEYKRYYEDSQTAQGDVKADVKEERVLKAVSAVVWPIVLCIYLGWSFLGGAWGISWIIFPITGILTSAFSSAYRAFKGNE